MFIIALSSEVQIGDTVDARINGEDRQVTWRDADTLVIGADDARRIVHHYLLPSSDGELRRFLCSDSE
jgi:hypothetical protein